MALFENLQVYKDCYDLLLSLYQDLNKMPRDVRFTLLETMKKSLVRIEVLVYKANASQDKLPFLSQAKDLLVEVKVGLRLLHDLHYINVKTYGRLAEKAECVSKQLTSWYNYQNKSARSQSPA